MSISNAQHDLRGGNSLPLNRNSAFVITDGAVSVYGMRLQDGKPTGAQQLLFRCQTGEVLFGVESTHEFCLVLVGEPTATLEEHPLLDYLQQPELGLEALNSWVQRLV